MMTTVASREVPAASLQLWRRIRQLEAHVQLAHGVSHRQQTHLQTAAATRPVHTAAGPSTLLLHHSSFGAHSAGHDHPERPLRYSSCISALQAHFPQGDGAVRWSDSVPQATDAQITRVHTPAYVYQLRQVLDKAAGDPDTANVPLHLDADTAVGPGTRDAVLRAAGAVCLAVSTVIDPSQPERNAFCLVRPPGHHAESDRAMGFCFLNSIMIGAAEALESPEISRVAIFDFDVHHGNGTAEQASLRPDGRILYLSTHQHPFYPGTGGAQQYQYDGSDNKRKASSSRVVNVPLQRGAGSADFRAAVSEQIIPAIRDFKPNMLMLSAGFDAHEADPLAQIDLTDADFAWVTKECLDVAEELCEGRLVSVMEGGYDTSVLARNVSAHVELLVEAS
jgi:acetoin utilization deacetylase AcuC-like enzyme